MLLKKIYLFIRFIFQEEENIEENSERSYS